MPTVAQATAKTKAKIAAKKASKPGGSSGSIDYTKSPNESIDQYNARIAATRSGSVGSGTEGVPIRNEQQTNPDGYYGTKENPNPGINGNPSAFLFGGGASNTAAAPSLIFPPVLSSNAAQSHLNSKVKPTLDDAKRGIQEQRERMEAQRIADAEALKTSESTNLDNQTRQAKLEEIKQKALLIQKELQGDAPPDTTPPADPAFAGETGTTPTTPAAPTDPYDVLGATAADTAKLDKVTEDYYKEAENVSNTIKKISSGAIPLSSGEKAQVEGLTQQYQALIDEQKQINIGASGMANVRGYQTGAGEYDANFQVKTIGAIVTKGLNNVADLNTKMASAVAELESSFKKDKISAVKDAFEAYEKAAEKREKALQDTIDATTKAIQAAQKANQEKKDEINKIVLALRKNGAPDDVVFEAMSATTPEAALYAAGDYLEEGSGVVGEYLYAKRQGYKGSFEQYSNEDANRKRTVVNVSSGDKKANVLSSFASAFVPGAKLADGTPVLDVNGYITPSAWREAIAEAPALGIDRVEFIKTYGNQLWGGEDGFVPSSYGLTPVEQKLIMGELPE